MKNMSKKMVALALAAIMIGCAGCSAQNEQTENTATVIEESIIAEESSISEAGDSLESSEMESEAAMETSETSMETESSGTQSLEDILSSTIGAYTETDRSTIYETSEDGEHAIEVDGETAVYEGILVTKTGSSDGEDADFYGENAAIFATDGADLTITDAYITTDGGHANGVFSYGEGTTITISDSTILTESNNSGGLMTTGGGTMIANNLFIITQGGSSAAIRSDRGGGTVIVDGGYYETNGKGSPAIYSTADITVSNATLVGNVSEGVVVEGKNSVTLNNCTVIANHTEKNSNKSDAYQAVKIYQSMSGDAQEGMSYFTMNGGSMTSLNGGMFWVSNTQCTITIENVAFTYATDDFLTVEAAGWGREGSNGGHAFFTAKNQIMEGVITVDEISSLELTLAEGTVFTGQIISDGETDVVIEEGASWILTGDSYVDSLEVSGNLDLNGYNLYVDGELYEG